MKAAGEIWAPLRMTQVCTVILPPALSLVDPQVILWRCLSVSYADHLWLWRMWPSLTRMFFLFVFLCFPSAVKQKVYGAIWARFILHTNSLYPLSSQTSTFNKWLNKWQCTWCFQYAAIDRDSNFVPLCCSCHLESWLETSQTTCSQFASHSERTVFS